MLSPWCLTNFPSISLIDATLILDFLKNPDFYPGLLIKIMFSPLALIEDRLKILFLLF